MALIGLHQHERFLFKKIIINTRRANGYEPLKLSWISAEFSDEIHPKLGFPMITTIIIITIACGVRVMCDAQDITTSSQPFWNENFKLQNLVIQLVKWRFCMNMKLEVLKITAQHITRLIKSQIKSPSFESHRNSYTVASISLSLYQFTSSRCTWIQTALTKLYSINVLGFVVKTVRV